MRFSMLLALFALGGCHERIITTAPDSPKPGQLSVTGTATLDVSPDCADLTVTLSDDDDKPAVATSTVAQREAQIVAALEHAGVADRDLKLSLVTLEPLYDNNYQHVRGYRAAITVTVTTRDFGQISPLMQLATEKGATAVTSAFRRSDLPELKKHVRDLAIAAAKDKAKQTADALGITLGRVVSVSESANGMMWQQAYFPSNVAATSNGSTGALGGTLQPLTLDISVAYQI
jgi:uncharacterized protein